MPRSNNSPSHQRYRAAHPRQLQRIFEAERAALNGMRHVGHFPSVVDEIEGWTFRRCPCGFDLALSPSGKLWWLRKTHEAIEIASLTQLIAALSRSCRFHLRPRPFIPHPQQQKEVAANG